MTIVLQVARCVSSSLTDPSFFWLQGTEPKQQRQIHSEHVMAAGHQGNKQRFLGVGWPRQGSATATGNSTQHSSACIPYYYWLRSGCEMAVVAASTMDVQLALEKHWELIP